MTRWLATFFATVVAGASVLLAVWGAWLTVDPAEMIHFEYAILALVLALVGAAAAAALRVAGSRG